MFDPLFCLDERVPVKAADAASSSDTFKNWDGIEVLTQNSLERSDVLFFCERIESGSKIYATHTFFAVFILTEGGVRSASFPSIRMKCEKESGDEGLRWTTENLTGTALRDIDRES